MSFSQSKCLSQNLHRLAVRNVTRRKFVKDIISSTHVMKQNMATKPVQESPISDCVNVRVAAHRSKTSGPRQVHSAAVDVAPRPCFNLSTSNLTSSLADLISNTSLSHLSDVIIHRSKRMILDTIGVGIIGAQTEISKSLRKFYLLNENSPKSLVWGTKEIMCSLGTAAILNGISVHSMDFDDTWHPATHPSGPVLPAIMSLIGQLGQRRAFTTQDLLSAFNVGIQVQGILLRCSKNSKNIPCRFHPPAVVGIIGSAAAASHLLRLGPHKTRHALAIAASYAGAPMANAGTLTKPFHCGKSARFGLEAALLADIGIEGNENIFDVESGFGAFFTDFDPENYLQNGNEDEFVLHHQNVAIKRFPAHLGMHWAIDATLSLRQELEMLIQNFSVSDIQSIEIVAPRSKYINRAVPRNEHEARHSFQFNTCSALLDGSVSPATYSGYMSSRPDLHRLLHKVKMYTPDDNVPSFEDMYVEISVRLRNGDVVRSRCDTPYGHWRRPLSDQDVEQKFRLNTRLLPAGNDTKIIEIVSTLDKPKDPLELLNLLAA
ncbi:hypothetical protein CHS0354_011649 [Potamilus streckersoni]|uniref:Cis-aconitate decarboxylase n=1 Tax=Potamilus streckersoni TaxID=2493646 RepID=A0AAE0TL66_9BIVA|nr:hypothetical protein CHS0354_011649 [Potamilus streckersoni]